MTNISETFIERLTRKEGSLRNVKEDLVQAVVDSEK